MKNFFIGVIAMLLILLCFSFKTIYELQNTTAKVSEENGLLAFSYSEPLKHYRVIGNVKVGSFDSNDYSSVVFFLTKDAKKKYPTANAIIINNEKGIHAEVIEFDN